MFLEHLERVNVQGLPHPQVKLRNLAITTSLREVKLSQVTRHFIGLECLQEGVVCRRSVHVHLLRVLLVRHQDECVLGQLA